MKTVNMHQAKSQLSKLVEEALAGQDVVIAQARVEGLTLITADKRFAAYDVAVKLVQP